MRFRRMIPAMLVALTPALASGQSSDCSVSASGVAFGVLGLLEFSVDAAGEISVTCPAGTPYSIGLDAGLSGSDPTSRRLSSAGSLISYGLYKDSGRSQHWGQLGDAEVPVSDTGTRSLQLFQVYGRVPAQAAPTPGSYSDLITVTVTY